METNCLDYNNSDIESDKEFYGPVTKREILARLKHYNLLTEELIQPISALQKSDTVDEELVNFYWNIFAERDTSTSYKAPSEVYEIKREMSLERNNHNSFFSGNENISKRCENSPSEAFQNESIVTDESFEDSLLEKSINIPQNSVSLPNLHIPAFDESVNDNIEINEVKNEDSVIVISDDSTVINSPEINSEEDIKIKIENISENNDKENDEHDINELLTNSLLLNDDPEENLNIYDKLKHCSNNYIKNDKYTSVLSDSFISKNTESSYLNVIEEDHQNNSLKSESFVTEFSDFESSYGRDTSRLNDTLEEMEMLMKFGENYMKQDAEVVNSPTIKNDEKSNEIYETTTKQKPSLQTEILYSPTCSKFFEDILPNNTQSTKNSTNICEINKENIDENKPVTPVSQKSKTPILKQVNSDTHFKVPVKVPSARKSPYLKNIVSPISLYIKNSPKVPLIKKVTTQTIYASTFRELDGKKSSEKVQENYAGMKPALPVRSYKLAAKNIFLSKENAPNMPNNVRKLINGPLNPEIIKHVGRVKATDDIPQSSAEKFENSADLTMLSSTSASDAVFNISTGPEGDVSIYVSKNAVRTNFTTK